MQSCFGSSVLRAVKPPQGPRSEHRSDSADGWCLPSLQCRGADSSLVLFQEQRRIRGVRGSSLSFNSDYFEFQFDQLEEIETGATGAPIFDMNWRLIELACESWWGLARGVPMHAVVKGLYSKGFSWNRASGVQSFSSAAASETSGASLVSLDATVRDFAIPEPEDADADDDVWTNYTDDVSDADRWAWAKAAAVTAHFDPDKLEPAGEPSVKARAYLLLESTPVLGADGTRRWMLSEPVRVRALERLAQRKLLRVMRKAASLSGGMLDDFLGTFIEGRKPQSEDLQDPERLRAILQVAGWLAKTDVAVPAVADLRAAVERATLLAPFRHLTRGFFAGRDKEIKELLVYVHGPDAGADALTAADPAACAGRHGKVRSAVAFHIAVFGAQRRRSKDVASFRVPRLRPSGAGRARPACACRLRSRDTSVRRSRRSQRAPMP